MIDLLLPSTDGGVLAQVAAATVIFAAALFLVRRYPEWRLFTVGVWILTYAWFGLRTLH